MNNFTFFQKLIISGICLAAALITLFNIESNPYFGVSILVCIVFATFTLLLQKKGHSVSGITHFYPKRGDLNSKWWEELFSQRKEPREVFLMSQSMARTFTNLKQADAFVKWCNNGTKVKLLLLSPSNLELSQVRNVGRDMEEPFIDDPVQSLPRKIRETIDVLESRVLARIPSRDKKPMIRFATCDMPFSVNAVDDDMVVTLYGTRAEGNEQTTFLVSRKKGSAFEAFKAEFDRIWDHFSKIYPYEDPIITEYRKDWRKYVPLRNFENIPCAPRQAIIFPTYRCRDNCRYCMFREIRHSNVTKEMNPHDFRRILDELINFGVRYVEISGGGEPLVHGEIVDILSAVKDVRKKNEGVKFGLLTNGLYLNVLDEPLTKVFNDYIRISKCERVEREADCSTWRNNIISLLREKRSTRALYPRIGIKYLLTPENEESFVDLVKRDLNDRELSGIDHWRFRSDRRVKTSIIARIEQQVYYEIESSNLPNTESSVSLAMSNLYYPRNFRCWISPMHVVIAPTCDMFMCCNYLYDDVKKCLGSLKTGNFESIWRSNLHRELRQKIERKNCARKKYANCRYAEVQDVLEKVALAAGE